jgi:hypothetical protein
MKTTTQSGQAWRGYERAVELNLVVDDKFMGYNFKKE